MAEPTFTAPETAIEDQQRVAELESRAAWRAGADLDDVDEWDEWDEVVCERCNDDGMDPQNDYLLPCPACQGEQQP